MGHLLRKLRTRVYLWLEAIQSWSHSLDQRVESVRQPALQRLLKRLALETGNVALFLLQFPRLDVTLLTGEAGRIVYVGEADGFMLTLAQNLFPDGYEKISLGRIEVWKLPRQTHHWLNEYDLVLNKVSQFFPWQPRTNYTFANPVSVYQVLPLDKPFDELLAGGENRRLRKETHRMRRENFTCTISHEEADLRYFYERIYLPTAYKRYGEKASVMPYDAVKDLFQQGFLVCLWLDNQVVSMDICTFKDGVVHDMLGGILDGDSCWMERDAGIAAYWYVIKTAYDLGAKLVNFKVSLAWISDGVFHFKQRWGCHVVPYPHMNSMLLVHANQLTDVWRTRLNEIGFITRQAAQCLLVQIDSPNTTIESVIAEARKNGLDGVQLIRARCSQNFYESD